MNAPKERGTLIGMSLNDENHVMNQVFVVTISESFPLHGNEVTLRCFSSHEKAERWIEDRIEETVRTFGLDRSTAVDGWFVTIANDHTIQYDVCELNVE